MEGYQPDHAEGKGSALFKERNGAQRWKEHQENLAVIQQLFVEKPRTMLAGCCYQQDEKKSHFSWTVYSTETEERILLNALKIKVKGKGEMKAEVHGMGQILQKTNSEQRWVAKSGGKKKAILEVPQKCKAFLWKL